MGHKPYQEAEVSGEKFWDYNFKINGIVHEISVSQKTGKLFIDVDENQGE
jgi:hypothetical protein